VFIANGVPVEKAIFCAEIQSIDGYMAENCPFLEKKLSINGHFSSVFETLMIHLSKVVRPEYL